MAENVVSLSIRVNDEGTASLESFGQTATRVVGDVEGEASRLDAAFEKLGRSIDAGLTKAESAFERTREKIRNLGVATAALGTAGAVALGSFAGEAVQFSDALGRVDTLLGGTGVTIEQVRQ